ncbi:DUF3081 family protein [Pseudomaricurvus sp.]|uniref:DUF3081 family protein n=1 Tax=Pseudomaricurvus sp. TaxID=2004510 RepID=UPI003F6B2956
MTADTKLTARELLLAFERIKEYGEQKDDEYRYEQLSANLGYDGYTLTIANNDVSATLQFHNTLKINSPNRGALETFHRQIQRLCE